VVSITITPLTLRKIDRGWGCRKKGASNLNKKICSSWVRACASLLLVCLVQNAHAFRLWPKHEGVYIAVTEPFIEMHTGPGRGYPVFYVIERGERVRLFKAKTDWYKVETEKGKLGWVRREELKDTIADDGSIIDFSPYTRDEILSRPFEIGLLAGDFKGANAVTTYLSYHVTQNIATELKFTEAFGSFSNSKIYSLNLVHQTFPTWRISPFITLGAGVIKISPNSALVQTEERQDSILTAGGGLIIYTSRNMFLRLEYDNHTVLTKRENNEEVEEWKAGFSVLF